jgi:ABC-type transport system involved in cytochrome c biogenesis permease subunit
MSFSGSAATSSYWMLMLTVAALGAMVVQLIFARRYTLAPLLLGMAVMTLIAGLSGFLTGAAEMLEALANVPADQRNQLMSAGTAAGLGSILLCLSLLSTQVFFLAVAETVRRNAGKRAVMASGTAATG